MHMELQVNMSNNSAETAWAKLRKVWFDPNRQRPAYLGTDRAEHTKESALNDLLNACSKWGDYYRFKDRTFRIIQYSHRPLSGEYETVLI